MSSVVSDERRAAKTLMSNTASTWRYAVWLCLLDDACKLSGKAGLILQSFRVDSQQPQDFGCVDFARTQ